MNIQSFFKSIIYFLILSGFTFFIWINQLDFIGMSIFALVSFFILIFVKNSVHVLPFFFNMMFMISQTDWSLESIPIYLYVLPLLLIVGFIIHFFRFERNRMVGQLTLPLLLMFLAMVLSIFNTEIFNLNYVFYLVIGLFYLFIYFFFLKTLHGDHLKYLIRLFFVIGILIAGQVFFYYMQFDDIALALQSDRVDLGWGISNFVATYLIICISAATYYVKHKPYKIISSIIIAAEILMLMFTLSRGGFLAFVALSPLLLIYLYHGQKHKFIMTIYLLIIINLLVILFVLRTDYFMPLFDRFKALDFTEGNGRVDLWIQAYHKFKQNPLFGAGLFARVEGDYFGFYHNTFMHTLASLGLLGLVSLLWQILVVVKVFLRQMNQEKTILFLALLGANLHGLVDNVYYMPQFMIIFFVLISAVEIVEHNKEIKPRIWRPAYAKK